MKTLIYCLDILKIEKDSEFYRDALDLVQKNLIESAMKVMNGLALRRL
jgi:hypothetical protein